MLDEIAQFITENPIIILFGFFSSILGTGEIIFSVIKGRKNKVKERMLEEKTSKIYAYLNEKADFFETSNNLIKAKEELEILRNQIEIELPFEKRSALINEQIKYEENLIKEANIRLKELKNELGDKDEISLSKSQRIFNRFRLFITSENTKAFISLLLFLGSILYFFSVTTGAMFTKVLGILSMAILVFFVKNNYSFLQTEKGEKLITIIINIALSTCFIDSLLIGSIGGVIWCFVLIMLSSIFLKVSNIFIDLILPIIPLPLFISIFAFVSYEFPIIITIVMMQIMLIFINVIRFVYTLKNK